MELKDYQQGVLDKCDAFLGRLKEQITKQATASELIRAQGLDMDLGDPCTKTWDALNAERRLPYLLGADGLPHVAPYLPRRDAMKRSIPNLCIKVPTGGGKTLLATAILERIQTDFFARQTGLVLWIVPSDAIYTQTWKHLANREHPYRQMLERASGGRVKLLEKTDAFTKRDTEAYLCVLLLMLPSAARQTKDTLRMFKDSGRFPDFFPVEDDPLANRALLDRVPNLDVNDLIDQSGGSSAAHTCSIKQSLGNVLRLQSPVIIVDEGHKAYSETARETLNGFNPRFILELSATPNAGGRHASNVLVSVPGTALKDEAMIKLPINIINEDKGTWRNTLMAAHAKLAELTRDADKLQAEEGRYIRPIMLIRVERTGKEQRDSGFVHAEDARECLLNELGVNPEEIRLKTSETDDLGDEDLALPTCAVRYIITKAALQEGWDCPFAYMLTLLSKTTAATSLTQMIGRVLRQPGARLTGRATLDECYVYTFEQEVSKAVESVRRGLEEEGMADLASQVKISTGTTGDARITTTETLGRRNKFANSPGIFLPRVLHRDGNGTESFRALDYERDILGELEWEAFHYLNAGRVSLDDDKVNRTIAKINVRQSDGKGESFHDLFHEEVREMPPEGLDKPFLVRQLMEVIPNPWQGIRILDATLKALRERGLSEEKIHANRFDLLKEMKRDLGAQVNAAAEELFLSKLKSGDIAFRLFASGDKSLNWKLAETVEIEVASGDKPLTRKNGGPVERSLFEKVFERDFNDLEKDTAWYLDDKDCIHWWHRIAVSQGSYSLQGWQKNKVFPDFLASIQEVENGKVRFAVLETKGDHLKGNDDTEYKRKLFEILTQQASATRAGELELGEPAGAITFTMLMQESWKQELNTAILAQPVK